MEQVKLKNIHFNMGQTYWTKIYISGSIHDIEHICRRFCGEESLCVTVSPTRFIYRGGEEIGAEIGLINYPKYSAQDDVVLDKTKKLAEVLLNETFQDSVLIMTPRSTYHYTKRKAKDSDV